MRRAPHNLTVLIVDDHAPFRGAARLVVELADGFEVVGEADGGLAAVAAAALLRPRLVLMDLHMPDLDGLEATRRIRAADPGVSVLVLSTHEPGEHRDRSRAAGALGFLPKSEFGPLVLEGLRGELPIA